MQPPVKCPIFEEEWARVVKAYAKSQEMQDAMLADTLNTREYCAEGQEIECGCCCLEFSFEKLVQCADGHLFCFKCVERNVEEHTFGALNAVGGLRCMSFKGCDEYFPWSEVRRALSPKVLAKYEQRQAEDSVSKALLEDLVWCPFCSFPVELEPDQRVLDCPECKKSSCRLCKEPSHVPLTCEEVEKKSETNVRLRVEELMTKAVLRTCSNCKMVLIKNEGCNKVTCRCGHSMCYVCRMPIKSYSHFCRHPREPNKKCSKCNNCSLWEQEDFDVVAKKAREEALQKIDKADLKLGKRAIAWSDDVINSDAAKRAK
ncbi:hypothetical protein CBR_g37201 [Chara braunii]|uniref:RING-type domain-containing protein n=1 Tax=Chara braunii TaxID=69332 RepID=A0A388LME0_CHABU|nr:hypothetical protein CBR_g37201 [Chara braunii]|eukprot:GBG83489.1 hypothetical protein CBR_g37201 [Chara braunii]